MHIVRRIRCYDKLSVVAYADDVADAYVTTAVVTAYVAVIAFAVT